MKDVFRAAMQRMRKHTQALKANEERKENRIKALGEVKGSSFYEKKVKEIRQTAESERVRITKETQKDMIDYMHQMRDNVGRKATKAPSSDMVNTLTLLKGLDRISAGDFKYYAEEMKDCPVALKTLQQIAQRHNVTVSVPDTDGYILALDKMEGYFAAYLSEYRGTDDVGISPLVRQMYEWYFRPEDFYKNCELKSSVNADRVFLERMIGVNSCEFFSDPENPSAKVEYVFSSLSALSSYIEEEVKGMDEKAAKQKTDEILSCCPMQYSKAYYEYQRSGAELPLDHVS